MPDIPIEISRQEHLNAILQSPSRHKLIVAGPGTGKTYTFKQLLVLGPGNHLVMTFINNLVNEMAKDLAGTADVRTFHSYCRKLLHKLPPEGIRTDFIFFPKLKELIALDAPVLSPHLISPDLPMTDSFDAAFRNLEDDARIHFFLSRADYYNAVGFDDSVHRVLRFFHRDPETVPSHGLLILDEYQDFNALEVAFISMLEERSASLIVGDDDQAIYTFRGASPEFLRRKASDPNYLRFPLPYCSRCTEAVVTATQSVISHASRAGLLRGRIPKDLICYAPDKAADSAAYPSLVVARCSTHSKKAPYIPRYIERVLADIPPDEVSGAVQHGYPLALVAAPSHYLSQIHSYLASRFPNVLYTPRPSFELTELDPYYCLLADTRSNLGWRILLQFHLPEDAETILASTAETGRAIIDILDPEFVHLHISFLESLRSAIQAPDDVSPERRAELEDHFHFPLVNLLTHFSASALLDQSNDDRGAEEAVEQPQPSPHIRLTTYSGCKGLSAAYTFIAGLERGVFPHTPGQPSDTEVCQFIVAITRTRKQCHLITTRMFAGNWQQPSEFLDWLPPALLQRIEVTKDFFE